MTDTTLRNQCPHYPDTADALGSLNQCRAAIERLNASLNAVNSEATILRAKTLKMTDYLRKLAEAALLGPPNSYNDILFILFKEVFDEECAIELLDTIDRLTSELGALRRVGQKIIDHGTVSSEWIDELTDAMKVKR